MSLASRKKQREADAAAGKPLATEKGAARPPRRKRRRLATGGIVLLILAVFVGLLPTIMVHTPLLGYFIRRSARLDGSLTFQQASLGWFSQTSISGLAIRDAQGDPVFEADSIACDRTLLQLIFKSSNLGKLRIEKPRLDAKLAHDGSNLETVFARWLGGGVGSPSGESASGVDLTLAITDGEATVSDQESHQTWHVANLQAEVDLARRTSLPTRIEAAAVLDDRGHQGNLVLKSHLKPSAAPPADPAAWAGLAGTDGDLSLQTTALPLAMFQCLAARGMPGLTIDGTLDANLAAQWAGPANVKLEGNASGGNLAVAAPVLGSDVIRLDHLQAVCHAARQDRQVTIEDTKIDCDLGSLSAAAHIDLGDRGLTSPADLLPQRDGGIQGTLDLARLARMLPGTLRIPAGMEITSGQVQVAIQAATPPAAANADGSGAGTPPTGLAWHARLESNRLAAFDHGRPIQWDRPLTIDLAMHQTDQGPVVDNVVCESDALRVNASGTLDRGLQLKYQGDMARLGPWLSAATGGTGLQFGGRLSGTAFVQQSEGNFACRAEGDIEQLTATAASGESLQDPRVHCAIEGGYQTAGGLLSIDQAELRFDGAQVFGFQVGPGDLKLHAANGTLLAEPLQVSCNQGTIALQPELRMAAQPMELRLSAGTLANHVQLDAAACRSALKYVVPLLASATQSQGQFSIQLDGCRIPLGDLTRAEIGGRVIVHSATMSPGPMVQQLATLLSATPSLVRIPPESVILFRMTGGRVYHQGLVMEFPELTMRTYGSVGLDDSLKVMVETSVPLAWLPSNSVTDAIRKQKMQIPVGGTLKSPQVDFGELARVKNQVLGNLARGVLQSDLGNQLNRLIQPGK